MRDQLKDSQYFDEYISQENEQIDDFNHGLAINRIKPDRIKSVKFAIFRSTYHVFIAMYSRGDSIEQLGAYFPKVVRELEENWMDHSTEPDDKYSFDDYYKVLWFLSLGILLKVDDSVFRRIVAVFDKDNKSDFISDYLISTRIPGKTISDHIRYKTPYEKLAAVIKEESKNNASQLLSNFLQKEYYRNMKMAYWYNAHNNKFAVYFGYWCFEAAAVAYTLGLDDSSFRDNQYYPKDLVDYARTH